MARPARKTRTVKKDVVVKATESTATPVDEVITDEPIEEVEDKVEVKADKSKTQANDDLIDCISSSTGKTFVYGEKSKQTYEFEAQGVTVGIQYCDLVYMINSNSSYLYRPFIIVKDDDFVSKYPKLKAFYNETWSRKGLNEILKLPPDELKNELDKMPDGIKKSLQDLVATKIANGTMDSVSRIKVLDDYFDTQMMLLTGLVD